MQDIDALNTAEPIPNGPRVVERRQWRVFEWSFFFPWAQRHSLEHHGSSRIRRNCQLKQMPTFGFFHAFCCDARVCLFQFDDLLCVLHQNMAKAKIMFKRGPCPRCDANNGRKQTFVRRYIFRLGRVVIRMCRLVLRYYY